MQAEVTTELSEQVFTALETLLRGFEAADLRAGGSLLRPLMEQEGDPLYQGLLTVLLRLVFLLYAEDSGLLPTEHPLFSGPLLALRALRAPGARARAIPRRDEPPLQRLAAAPVAVQVGLPRRRSWRPSPPAARGPPL